MANKKLTIKNKEGYDYYYDWEEVIDRDTGRCLYYVSNLEPEDAIIGRDLFDGWNWVEAVRYGMELAKQGYDGIDVENVTIPYGEARR